jgi:hypothetical protein
MRGRVAAVNTVFISSSNELGEFESGATAAWWGPVRAVVVGGAGTIAVVLLVLARWPALLSLPPLDVLRSAPPGGGPPGQAGGDGRPGSLPPQDASIVSASDVTGVQKRGPDA